MVSAQYLLEGSIYALEQCGRLLGDAVSAYRKGSYSSAIVFAAFAREEMGKSRMLRGLRRQALDGTAVTVADIRRACRDHGAKQGAAQLSITQRADNDSPLGRLLRTRMTADPQSEEYQLAEAELAVLTKRQRQETPGERHRLRMTGLYVDPDDAGTTWCRPCERGREEALDFVNDAVNDYATQYHQLTDNFYHPDPEFLRAFQAWAGRPSLPDPEWILS